MQITDKEVLKELKRVSCCALDESVEGYPDDERDGRSDMQFFADEVSYCVSMYEEDGTTWRDDLLESREILRKTNGGKVVPLNMKTLRPVYSYGRIAAAKNVVNEYRRLKNCLKRLNDKGYFGRWA